jgi:hypothetical protein
MKKYTSVEEQIEFGLDTVDPEQKIEISLRDFMYVFQTFGELIRFFHQPMHYPHLKDVEKFLGSKDSGAFAAICRCYYDVLGDLIPEEIDKVLDETGRFDNPDPPYYFREKQ